MSLINVKKIFTFVIDVNTAPFYKFHLNGNESACVGRHSLHSIKRHLPPRAATAALRSSCSSFFPSQTLKSVVWL